MPFEDLPIEVLGIVGSFCDTKQLGRLARVSHRFHHIYNPLLYKHNALHDDPYEASVLWAAQRGSLETLKIALANGADINCLGAPNEDHVWTIATRNPKLEKGYGTPLHFAVLLKHEYIVRWLLENGARMDIPSAGVCWCNGRYFIPNCSYVNVPWYPIHFAISHGIDESILSLLLDHGAVLATREYSALANAIREPMEPVVDTILKHDNFDLYYRETDGRTPYDMIKYDVSNVFDMSDVSRAQNIIEMLANRGVPIVAEAGGRNTFRNMLAKGNHPVALSLLRAGSDVIEEEHGDGIIEMILSRDEQECIDAQRMHGNLEEVDRAMQDRRELLKLAIQRGADVNRETKIDDHADIWHMERPLYWALVISKDVECVRIMLDAGARISDAFVDGESGGLLRAFFNEMSGWPGVRDNLSVLPRVKEDFKFYEDCIELLLELGAHIDAPCHDQKSALIEICYRDWDWEDCTYELEFVAKHARLRNVSAEYVQGLMKWKNGNTRVRHLLGQLHEKLRNEEYWNDRCLD